jgi:hypothetical protein
MVYNDFMYLVMEITMQITVLGFGTTGDVQPMILLAEALQKQEQRFLR